MPFHLTPLSRRRFLQTGAVATVLGPEAARRAAAQGAGEGSAPERWALLADTHIAADPELVVRGAKLSEHLSRVVADILAEEIPVQGVLINGDCAFDDGQPGDYTLLAELLAPLGEAGIPVHLTLGNHDDRVHFRAAFAAAAGISPLESHHVGVLETPFADWILVDTLRYVNQVEGELGEAQLAWLAERLAAHPDRPAIVFGHHYPEVVRTDVIPGDPPPRITGLVDSEAFLELLTEQAAAKAYVYGHSHRWSLDEDEAGLHRANLPPVAYVFSEEQPNGWVRATLESDGCTLELRALDPAHPAHGVEHRLAWR